MVGIGSTLGGYELLAKLGRGGFASLYVGQKRGPGGFRRLAAVKVVHPHLAAENKFRLMFIDEARLNTRVAHPNIVRVEDFGEEAGTLYMVMEYVHGCSLAELLQTLSAEGRRPSVPLAVHILMEMADALHAAHEARDEAGKPWNIVHRDVSPQNVLLSYSGYCKLIDFGIAKARYRAQVTKTGGVKGKLRYMAPEQATGGEVDRRLDIYALGVVAWELLTMRRAFKADNPLALLAKIRNPDIPRVSELADVPSAVDDVIAAAMSVDPGDRPGTARDLRRALAEACPEALRMEHVDLADLLSVAMQDHRHRQQEHLPSDLSASLSPVELERGQPGSMEQLATADEVWEPAEEIRVEASGQIATSDEDIATLLERVAAEAAAEPTNGGIRDTVQESREEVLARLAERRSSPAPESTPPAQPKSQRHLPTLQMDRTPAKLSRSALVGLAVFLALVGISVGVFSFLLIRALL